VAGEVARQGAAREKVAREGAATGRKAEGVNAQWMVDADW